jgi:hypothetical protein
MVSAVVLLGQKGPRCQLHEGRSGPWSPPGISPACLHTLLCCELLESCFAACVLDSCNFAREVHGMFDRELSSSVSRTVETTGEQPEGSLALHL